jgi:NAD(P)-dependent dehydrogenase (short-subunit alcohol dehydrogenase family)
MLVERGARVVIFDLPASAGEQLARDLGTAATFVPGDVTSEDDARAAVDAAGELRIAVNCAGIGSGARIAGRDGPFPLDVFRRVIEVNLIGTFNVLRLAAARMAEQEPLAGERGVIVNTASIAAFEGQVGQAAYTASKAGIVGLTICAARDLATQLVRVCTIAPGTFDTPLLGRLDERFRQTLADAIPHASTPSSRSRSLRTRCSTARRSASTGRSGWRPGSVRETT